jgi:hypothetical protein
MMSPAGLVQANGWHGPSLHRSMVIWAPRGDLGVYKSGDAGCVVLSYSIGVRQPR